MGLSYFLWLLGGDCNHNYNFPALPKVFHLLGPMGSCSASCLIWVTSVLFAIFSVTSSFPFGPSVLSL